MRLLDNYTNDIKTLCSKYSVEKLYAFGSVLTDHFNITSDIDFIVEFDKLSIDQYADNYFDLKFALEETFKRKIDLLEEKAIRNPYFRQAIEKQRQLVYAR